MLSRLVRISPIPKFTQRFRCTNFRCFSDVVLSFKKVSYEYVHDKKIVNEANFGIQDGSKVTIMGQNGAGKSTMIKLMNSTFQASEGSVNVKAGYAVATATQVMEPEYRDLNVLEYFTEHLHGNTSGIESSIASVLQLVQLDAPHDRLIKSFSGGQQARLLLAAALIVDPDILLLDEPTNNLDYAGIDLLTTFIQTTTKTVVVISHDEDFLNSFSDSVLYLDTHSKKVESYDGNYHLVKREIAERIRKENQLNTRLIKEAQKKKDQAGSFANKGGGMRKVAKKMREEAASLEEKKVDVRKEDVALKAFTIPLQQQKLRSTSGLGAALLRVRSVSVPIFPDRTFSLKAGAVSLEKGSHVQLVGPNGIGKTTLLESLAANQAAGVDIHPEATIGYYRQDFNNLDFDSTVLECLEKASDCKHNMQEIRVIAASFMLRGDMVKQKVVTLSEGQKGLLSLACLTLQEPAVLIMDEPTNHINFRHLPALAKALKSFSGALVLVSHDAEFVSKVGIDQVIDLGFETAL